MRIIRNQESISKAHPLTKQRKLVLKLLKESSGHMDARELYRQANKKDSSVSLATVYRCLNLFKELRIIEETRLSNARCYYEIRQAGKHQHFICRGCGKVTDFRYPLFDKLVKSVQREHGFKVIKADLYLEGYCAGCYLKKKQKEANVYKRKLLVAAKSRRSQN